MWKKIRIFFLFFLAAGILYSPVFLTGFVGDDAAQVVNYSYLHRIEFSGEVFFKSIGIGGVDGGIVTGFFYRPITFSLYSILWNLTNGNPVFFHIFQLLVFVTGVCFLYCFFRLFFIKKIAVWLTLAFLVHPANNDLGAYIAALGDTLVLFFGLAALIVVGRVKTANLPTSMLTGLLLLAAMLSKESGVLLWILCGFFALFRKRLSSYWAGFLTSGLIYVILRANAGRDILFYTLKSPFESLSLSERFLLVPQVVLGMLHEAIIPTRNFLWQHYPSGEPRVALSSLALMLLIFTGIIIFWYFVRPYSRGQASSALFFVGVILLGLCMYTQLIPLETLFAARWLYVAIIGLLGVAGSFNSLVVFRQRRVRVISYIVCGIMLSFYAMMTVIINIMWLDWENHFGLN